MAADPVSPSYSDVAVPHHLSHHTGDIQEIKGRGTEAPRITYRVVPLVGRGQFRLFALRRIVYDGYGVPVAQQDRAQDS